VILLTLSLNVINATIQLQEVQNKKWEMKFHYKELKGREQSNVLNAAVTELSEKMMKSTVKNAALL